MDKNSLLVEPHFHSFEKSLNLVPAQLKTLKEFCCVILIYALDLILGHQKIIDEIGVDRFAYVYVLHKNL